MNENMTYNKQTWYSTVVFTMILLLGLCFNVHYGRAAEVNITGAGANNAVITDMNGKNVTGETLNKYTFYEASYKWSLPENTIVKAGDTATFTLSSNVQLRVADTRFNVIDSAGHVVGQFDIQKGSKTGTLTFNDYFSKNQVKDIHGTLVLKVNGTQENAPSTWFLNKSGWLDSQKVPNWTVVYNPQSKQLTNVKLTDTLKDTQTFDVNSIQLWYGHVENNQFVADKKVTNPVQQGLVTVSGNDKVMTANFKDLDSAIQLVYKTNANTTAANFTLTNVASASADQLAADTMTCTLEVGGKAVANGTKTQDPVKPDQKPDQKPNQPQKPENPDQKPNQPQKPENPDQKPNQPQKPKNPDQKPIKPCKPVKPHHRPCRPQCSSRHYYWYYYGYDYDYYYNVSYSGLYYDSYYDSYYGGYYYGIDY